MLILHVPCPLPPHERLWLKSTWQLLCSPPPFGSLSPALPCGATAPRSMPFYGAFLLLEEGEGERLGLPMRFHPPVRQSPKSPSPTLPPPCPEPLQITRIPSHLPSCVPMAHWSVVHAGPPQTPGLMAGELQWAGEPLASPHCWGANVASPLHVCLPAAEPEQGCSPPSLPPHHQHPAMPVPSPCTQREGGRPGSSGISPHPGTALALGCAASWHQAPLLCYKENIQIKQLTGFCSFPLFPVQN